MIIYGRNSYRVRSAQLAEIGINEQIPGIVQFELRQNYAHIYWIPLFPLGSQWCIRKTDNKLYEVNDSLLPALNALPRPKNGWIAFTGLILIAAALLWFSIFVR
ncbi:hypothetical protein [Chitinophaga tropicalis]|uniref:Uncharacterized protein n=1 Tax=Chitinophaga tropicalis TaxID=2683588 RepID=A0A7K1UDT1_9BACT|nr:hypothetical protein [Chitinophaga tropicalis]MVT12430.1 hypothetical protein [Chitinophaga tropicalis]